AEEHRYLVVQEKVQTSDTAHSTTRQAQITLSRGGSKRGPESKERTKREREKQTVVGNQANNLEDFIPAVQHPAPALARIQPIERTGMSTGSLMQPAIPVERIRENLTVRRRMQLIGQQLGLGRERQARQVGRGAHILELQTSVGELASIETVTG